MATRRSRIKAVANLPARRNRPVALTDVKKEDSELVEANDVPTPAEAVESKPCVKASALAENVKDGTLNPQSQSTEDSRVTSLDDSPSTSTVIIKAAQTESSATFSQTSASSLTAASGNPTTPASEAADVNSTSKRPPLRTRRSKPTVNLTAAARKRPATDVAVTSPCSPPPIKLKCLEAPLRKNSESDSNNDVLSAKSSNTSSQSVVAELNNQTLAENNQVFTPLSPLPVTVSSPTKQPSCTNGLFKTPATPPSKSKDLTPSDASNKGDGIMPGSPQKDPSNSKRKQSSNAQKVAAARKNLKSRISSDGIAPRAGLTMFDLIFYNPSKNPMKSSGPSSNKPRPRLDSVSSVSSIQSIHEDRLNEESVDDLEGAPATEDTVEEKAMPVPQVKVGPDGSLILDEQSLVIETTDAKKNREELEKSDVIVDTGSSYGHYKKIVRSKDWSDHETKKFYRALNVVGTDFSLMKPYFRNRTRRELKIKFKKEERFNPNLINKALGEPLDFDISELEKECELEDEEEKRIEEEAKEKAAEKLKEKIENAQVKAKKPTVKKKVNKCLAELGLEAENTSATKKIRPQANVLKKKKMPMTDAERDYNMLGLGVHDQAFSTQGKNKKTLGETGELVQAPMTEAESSSKKVKPVKRVRKKPPSSDNSAAPVTFSGESARSIPVNSSGDADPEAGLPVQPPKSCIVSTPGFKVIQSSSQSRIQIIQAPPQAVISTSGVKVVPSNPPSRIQFVKGSLPTLVSTADPKSVQGAPPQQVQIIQRSSQDVAPTTGSNVTIPTPPRIQFVQTTPQTIVPSSGSNVILSTPPRIQFIQTTPQTIVPTSGSNVILSSPQSRIQIVQTAPHTAVPPSGPKVDLTTPQSRIQIVQASPQTNVPTSGSKVLPVTPQSRIQIVPISSETNVPATGSKADSSTPVSQIQVVQAPPQTTLSSTSLAAATPRSVNILRRQVPPSRQLPSANKPTASQSVISSPTSSRSQTTSIPNVAVPVPSNSTCIVSNSGAKLVQQATPPPRIQTVQLTPQGTATLPGVGATTPVSRLLPSTPPLPRMEPGSIIVLKTPLPQDPDRHVLQVYMVTNTPPGSGPSPSVVPHSPIGFNLLSGPSVQPAHVKSPSISDDSDSEKVLTKL